MTIITIKDGSNSQITITTTRGPVEILAPPKPERAQVVSTDKVVYEITSQLGVVFAVKSNDEHFSQICTCKQFNAKRAEAINPGTRVGLGSHLDCSSPNSDVVWYKVTSSSWIRMPSDRMPFPAGQAS